MTMNALISKFQPISLSEMGGIKLTLLISKF